MNREFQMFKLDLEKIEEPEIKLPTSAESKKKQDNFRKTSTSTSLTIQKPLTCYGSKQTMKILRVRSTRPPYVSPEKPVYRSRSNS